MKFNSDTYTLDMEEQDAGATSWRVPRCDKPQDIRGVMKAVDGVRNGWSNDHSGITLSGGTREDLDDHTNAFLANCTPIK